MSFSSVIMSITRTLGSSNVLLVMYLYLLYITFLPLGDRQTSKCDNRAKDDLMKSSLRLWHLIVNKSLNLLVC